MPLHLEWPEKYHTGRWRFCHALFIKELLSISEAQALVQKYRIRVDESTGDIPRVNFDFPDDFDQDTLPEALRKVNKPAEDLGAVEV